MAVRGNRRGAGRWRRVLAAALAAAFTVVTFTALQSSAPTHAAAPTTHTFTGALDVGGDSWDLHQFHVTAGDTIDVVLDWDDPAADLNLFLRDPDGTGVATAFGGFTKPETISYVADVTGTWKIGIKARAGATPYSAAVAVTTPTLPYSGAVDAAGNSWVTFDVALDDGDRIDAVLDWTTTSSGGEADLNLFLRDPSGVAVAKAVGGFTKPEVVGYDVTVPGTYVLGVKAKRGAADFVIDVEIDEGDPPVTGGPLGTDWPMWQFNERNEGVTPDEGLTASNAGELGLLWQSNTGAKAFTSPAVVYNPSIDKTLVYIGRQAGELVAYDALTGNRQWTFVIPNHIQSSPAIVDGVLYVGASDHHLYALDAATGDTICDYHSTGVISASPVVVDVPGVGRTVFVGENGVTGSDDGGSFMAVNGVDANPAADCSLQWRYDGFGEPEGSRTGDSGSWSPPAFGFDKNGRALVVFGGSSPDNSAYALDAVTGARVWRFQSEVFNPDNDMGAGPTISPPGVNGFADGVAYIVGKNRIMHALNLETGELIWEFRIRDDSPGAMMGTVSTAALYGTDLLVGYGEGLYRLDAVTGALIWKSGAVDPTGPVFASPTVSGPAGDEVVLFSDAYGQILAASLATGEILFRYQTGDFIYSSPVVVGEHVFVAGADGFLYALTLGGASGGRPETAVTSPTNNQTITNPGGDVSITGTAGDDIGVERVKVSIQNRNTNKWWDGTVAAWVRGYTENDATLASPGGTSTNWTYAWPAPFEGGPFYVQAIAVDADGQNDPTIDPVRYSVTPLGDPPETTIEEPGFSEIFILETRDEFPVTARGTATDLGGANPGIKRVRVVVKNREHEEFFCGFEGCSGGPDSGHGSNEWTPTYTVLNATLSNPGGTTTDWEVTFPVYDHPHSYSVIAWAIDNDNEEDVSRAATYRFCVRDPGDTNCS